MSTTLGLSLPPEWRTVPLDGPGFDAFVVEQRHVLARRGELTPGAQRQFEEILRRLRDDAVAGAVELLAVFAAAIDTPTGAGLLAATCSLSTLTQSSLGTELPITVNMLLAACTREVSGDTAGGVVPASPGIIDLPAGRTAHLVQRTSDPHAGGGLLSHHYVVPFDEGRRAALLALATPNHEFAGLIGELFERIAMTLRVPMLAAPAAAR